MANYSLVLGIKKGTANLIGEPIPNCGAKRSFKTVLANNGFADGTQYDEVWLCDTVQGRLRRKSFVCMAPEQNVAEAPVKRRGRPPKAIV